MCDSLVVLPPATADHSLILAKNSDREPDEAQGIQRIPGKMQTESIVQCTYITIPQVTQTYECILSKPFQMWGAEMGVNEHGVVIGNEAVFTKVKFEKHNNGLTGMDLLRLALERSKTAREAVDCITGLLTLYGQIACGGYRNKKFYYHNSFLIADGQEAFVLETAGHQWALETVKSIRSISNALSVGVHADELSSNAKPFAQSKGWWKEGSPFSFQEAYSDWLFTTAGRAKRRQACTMELAERTKKSFSVPDAIRILQTHNLGDAAFRPSKANTASICMHATGLLNPSSTTGSMVAVIRPNGRHTVWLTGTAHPCLSVYMPFFFQTTVLDDFIQPSAKPDASLWWKAEQVHRWINKDYQKRKALINEERQELQDRFIHQEKQWIRQNASLSELEQFSAMCLRDTEKLIDRWKLLID
ncbi:MAG: C69 family dipeptidase [Cyclobacteriaceae bacterium]|nr:C69 family dipeptidase [Cyclobacteriaceae bacterium]